jgi:hypothetical protein
MSLLLAQTNVASGQVNVWYWRKIGHQTQTLTKSASDDSVEKVFFEPTNEFSYERWSVVRAKT